MYLSDIFTITVNLSGLPGISVPCGPDFRETSCGDATYSQSLPGIGAFPGRLPVRESWGIR
jgi:hypothetical protein